MNRINYRKAYIVCVYLCGICINLVYGIELLQGFFDPQFNNAVGEIFISAIALEFGWAALLLWAIGKPCERRHIVLFTALPMTLGNLLHSFHQTRYVGFNTTEIALNLTVGGVIAGLFVLAFFLANRRIPS